MIIHIIYCFLYSLKKPEVYYPLLFINALLEVRPIKKSVTFPMAATYADRGSAQKV